MRRSGLIGLVVRREDILLEPKQVPKQVPKLQKEALSRLTGVHHVPSRAAPPDEPQPAKQQQAFATQPILIDRLWYCPMAPPSEDVQILHRTVTERPVEHHLPMVLEQRSSDESLPVEVKMLYVDLLPL